MAFLACAAACMLSGCGQKTNTTDQEAYRQYGINCIESGDYPSAVDAFQKALDQSHGKVTAAEIDICYYKAEAQFLSGARLHAVPARTAGGSAE